MKERDILEIVSELFDLSERIAKCADQLDNILEMKKAPMPPQIHLDGIWGTLPEISKELKLATIQLRGDNPWENTPWSPK